MGRLWRGVGQVMVMIRNENSGHGHIINIIGMTAIRSESRHHGHSLDLETLANDVDEAALPRRPFHLRHPGSFFP